MPTSTEFAIAFGIMGAIGVAAVAVPTTIGVSVIDYFSDNADLEKAFQERLREKLAEASLTAIAVSAFSDGNPACDKERPHGADFTAHDADKKVVTGTVCTAVNRESRIVNLKR